MPLTKVSYSMIQDAPVNVVNLGADPTGVADSTAAIQAAIDSGSSNVFIPDGTYKITSTLTVDSKWGFGIFGAPSNNPVTLRWAGAANGTMMQVTKTRQFIMQGLALDGDNIADTTLELLSGIGNTNTQQQYINCLFQNVLETSVFLNGNDRQLDFIYFKNCWWSVCDICVKLEGQSTFLIYIQGCTFGDFDSYGVRGVYGGQTYISDSGFIVGGAPGTPMPVGRWCVSKTNTFGEIVIENCLLEGLAKFYTAEDSSGFSNYTATTISNCAMGSTGSGTYSIIDYRQKGPLIIQGGAAAGGYGTGVNIFYQNPGNAQTGGYFYINGTKLESVVITTSGNSYVNGFSDTGTQYVGNGLKFPATSVLQTNPNTLDDYEEGTWTPAFTGLTTIGTLTSTGRYVKIGKLVQIEITISGSTSIASTAGTTYSTLPFAPSGSSTCGAVDYTSKASYGTGAIGTGDARCYTPTFGATSSVVISSSYETDE